MIYSYSSIATYKQCPAKFNFAYILKPEVAPLPPSPALERGTAIHDSVESYMVRINEFLHPDIHKEWGQYLHGIRESGAELRPEFKWGVTWEFEPCDYSAPNCMLHGFVDLLSVPEDPSLPLDQYEWKTGKKYDEHTHQTCVYAMAMLCHFPDRETVDSMTVYFDGHPHTNVKYHRIMLRDYKAMIQRDINKIVLEEIYPPMPSFKCKWCRYSKRNNNGPCEVG